MSLAETLQPESLISSIFLSFFVPMKLRRLQVKVKLEGQRQHQGQLTWVLLPRSSNLIILANLRDFMSPTKIYTTYINMKTNFRSSTLNKS